MCTSEAVSTAVEIAAQTGRLDFLSALLAAIALIFTLGGFLGFFLFRSDVKSRAAEVAREAAGSAVKEHMQQNAISLIKAALDDAEVVARLHLEFTKLGLDDSEDADHVDDDPNWVPDDAK